MVRLLQLRVFDTKRDQIVQCDEEPLHIASAPGCFIVSTAAGFLNVYSSESEGTLLFRFKTKNKDIWDLQYSQFDDSLLTVENESSDSAIRVVRHYVNWRAKNGSSATPTDMLVYDLVSNRSVRFFTIDSSQMRPTMTKPDSHRRLSPFPYFQIVVSTDGMVSLYRVQCSATKPVTSHIIQDDLDDTDAHFTWTFSIKAHATKIGLCDSYLSYSTTTEVFLLKFATEQTSMEEMSLTRMCKTAIETQKSGAQKLPNHSIILSTTSLKRVKNHPRRSGSSTLSRSSSFAGPSTSSDRTSSGFIDLSRNPSSAAPSAVSRTSSNRGTLGSSQSPPVLARASLSPGTSSDPNDSVELSKHHIDLIFSKSNAIKNKVPYAEMPLDVKHAQIIGAQGPNLGPAMTPAGVGPVSDIPSQLIGPIRDVHSYVVNTDEDFVLASAQLLFYRNFASTSSSVDSDDFLVTSNPSEDLDGNDSTIHSLTLMPIWTTCSTSAMTPPSTTYDSSQSQANIATLTPAPSNQGFTPLKESSNSGEGPLVTGVRLFASTPNKGHLWMFKGTLLCETAKYTFFNPTYKTIVTDTFVFSLTHNNTVLVYLTRNLDSKYSGASFERLKGESSSAPASSTGKRSAKPSPTGPPSSSKALVQQCTDPIFVGALDFLNLSTLCTNSNGNAMILCKSTEDQIAALRDASLSSVGKRGRSSSTNISATPPSPSHLGKGGKDSVSRTQSTLGWNLVFTHFNSVQFMLDQFKTWTSSEETIAKEDLDLLLESWTFTMSVLSSHSLAATSTKKWTSDEELANAIRTKRSIYGKLASFEFASNRLMRAATLWSLSDVPADKAIENLVQRMKKGQNEQIANLTQAACVEFLTRVLLGQTQRMDLIEQSGAKFADVVYAVLVLQNAPLLGQVVLESPLDKFELENTIILLEKTMSELEDKVQRVSNVVSSFLNNAVVLNLAGDVEAKPSPLDDFYSTQTLEERQLWMSTLALVVLLLRYNEDPFAPGEQQLRDPILARRTVVVKGNSPISNPENYLIKLPEAFLVPYLSTHFHLMFERGPATSSKNWTLAKLEEDKPSSLAVLLSEVMPWTCLEIVSSAGPNVFGHRYVTNLLSPSYSRMSTSLARSTSASPNAHNEQPAQSTSPTSTPPHLNPEITAPALNPVLLTAYYEYQIMSYISPTSVATTTSPLSGQTSNSPPIYDDPCPVSLVETIKALLNRYIDSIEMPFDEVVTHLSYLTSDLVVRTNPHNTDPPVSLEGIWKEYHRDFLMDCRFKFLASIPPVSDALARVRGPGATEQVHLELFYLCKLQALLCALVDRSKTFPSLEEHLKDINQHVVDVLASKKIPEWLTESLLMLCKPNLDKFQETVDTIVQRYPDALISFLKKHLNPSDMKRWKLTLDVLLARATGPNPLDHTVRCLEEFLKYMARNLTSKSFLELLPENGNVAFFIPYIELNLGRNASMDLLEQIQSLK